ncbi:Uncharacterised protein [marine metagenome]
MIRIGIKSIASEHILPYVYVNLEMLSMGLKIIMNIGYVPHNVSN